MQKFYTLIFFFSYCSFKLIGQNCSGGGVASQVTLTLSGLTANGDIGEPGNSNGSICFPGSVPLSVVGDLVSNVQITTSNGSWCSEANIRFGNLNGGAGGWQFNPLFFESNTGPCGIVNYSLDDYSASGTPIFETDSSGCIHYQVFDILNDAGNAQDFIFDSGSIKFYGCPVGEILVPSLQVIQYPDTVCVNDSFIVAAVAPMASDIFWYLDQVSGNPVSSGFGPLQLVVPSEGIHTLFAVAEYASGSDTTSVNFYASGLPKIQLSQAVVQNVATLAATVSSDTKDWFWNFGDSSSLDSNLIVDHSYSTNGSFTASFTATNQCGMITEEIGILIAIAAPSADILLSADTVCTNSFIDVLGQTPPNVLIEQWSWTFDSDANQDTATNIGPHQISWSSSGNKIIKLTVSNQGGSNTIEKPILVVDNPTSLFVPTVEFLTVSFKNLSIGGFSYFWDFGDGNTSTDFEPIHTYALEGTFQVTLTVTNFCGFITSDPIDISVITVNTSDPTWAKQVILYPNPTSHSFFINLTSTSSVEDTQMEIWSTDGRVVDATNWQIRSGNQVYELPLEHLPRGMYSLVLKSSKGSFVRMFIKE